MSKNPKIKGIIFQHDDNDYSVWMPDISKKENEKFLKTLLAVFGDTGLFGARYEERHPRCHPRKYLKRKELRA